MRLKSGDGGCEGGIVLVTVVGRAGKRFKKVWHLSEDLRQMINGLACREKRESHGEVGWRH